MTYEPREGVDYIVDLYAVVNIARDASNDEIKSALNERAMEYHPDRLQGVAPKFREEGERMARLLNRARKVLLSEEKRSEYDTILNQWDGILSDDGIPVATIGNYLKGEMASKTPTELEAYFSEQRRDVELMSGYSPKRLSFVERMMEQAGDDVDEDLREEYEAALLDYDRVLSIDEAERSQLLGREDISKRRYELTYDYADKVVGEIAAAREETHQQLQALAAGAFTTRLALLSGEEVEASATSILPASIELPAYYDEQAAKVQEIAKERESILLRRLNNVVVTYPEEELQQEKFNKFIVGIKFDKKTIWLPLEYDQDSNNANSTVIEDSLVDLLNQGEYVEAFKLGFNVFVVDSKEQIDSVTLINHVADVHVNKFLSPKNSD